MNKNLENNLKFLKLTTMSDCYKNECNNINNESVETVLDLIVKAEINQRKSNKINRLINDAGLFHNINLNDLKIDESRGLEKKYLSNFLQLHFLQCNLSIIITGPTGSGKTFLAQAIGYQACINLYKVKYLQLPLFLDEIISLHSNNALTEYITSFKNYKIIILDDFGLTEINQIQLQALFALINCYYKKITFIITSQLPIDNWLNYLTEKTISEAILDRVLSNSLRVNLKGESFR